MLDGVVGVVIFIGFSSLFFDKVRMYNVGVAYPESGYLYLFFSYQCHSRSFFVHVSSWFMYEGVVVWQKLFHSSPTIVLVRCLSFKTLLLVSCSSVMFFSFRYFSTSTWNSLAPCWIRLPEENAQIQYNISQKLNIT